LWLRAARRSTWEGSSCDYDQDPNYGGHDYDQAHDRGHDDDDDDDDGGPPGWRKRRHDWQEESELCGKRRVSDPRRR
jgi:hypothetical protein